MSKTNKPNTGFRIIQLSTLERTARKRQLAAYRHPIRQASIATISPGLQVQRVLISTLIATLTLFYPIGAYVVAEGGNTPATSPTASEPVSESSPAAPKPPTMTTAEEPVSATPAPAEPKPATPKPKEEVTPKKPAAQTKPVGDKDTETDKAADTTETDTSAQETTDMQAKNNITSTAQTGDATVARNTLAGDAKSGEALAVANVFNVLHSSASFAETGGVTTFHTDVEGDVFGDFIIDPAALTKVKDMPSTGSDPTSIQVQTATNGQIQNDISLTARSGQAAVTDNTTAGNATSGAATAVANIVNLMNSAVSSGSSFVGTLNIRGNLNGDILLPPGALNTLLGSSAPSSTTNSQATAQLDSNQTIQNNIVAQAASGDASVHNNTTGGTATSGTSETNVTILNLTGRQVVAANSLLVFVNVVGKWVGVIMDAPQGSTTAALASSVTANGCASVCGEGSYQTRTNQEITNNISVQAQSGDATVADNTTGGSARTGDAKATVNLTNILNSTFSLADWFGVLFINVFGSWTGSFGVDTAAGGLSQASAVAGTTTPSMQVFRFEPASDGSHRLARVASTVQPQTPTAPEQPEPQVQATTTQEEDTQPVGGSTPEQSPPWAGQSRLIVPGVGLLAGMSLLGAERLVGVRQRRRLATSL